ncbi:nitrite reductase/ring-hydroxylating ferredoxin subunit [Pedobacter cryoconitis]|uniref:Nitrite reductase/ring-hydroxylating ferredoxin subunit n=1 Tax=Pedobacter cryoconitis TaxID=188932 RepID=A0A7W8ZRS7_9SPHI|nr:hypothetical protein [Pedobacter cryoconitis]MBB5638672.1 nitrite reductase/ring-hydroxylating ferredoxin subunit [Pedobacter cryoconitis]MBB6274416.1 nitrite reductase/ring-hydroxylating ferredoxin subunit [Pedobacter cryoconitis]
MGKIAGFLLVLFLFSACGKETNQVPNVGINLSGFFTPAQLSDLKANGAIFIDGYGVAGIIIAYNIDAGGGGYAYKAFDRCSTVNPEKKCAVTLENAYTVVDPCSGAKYSLLDGTPTKAPAKVALRTYSITISGNNYRVTN